MRKALAAAGIAAMSMMVFVPPMPVWAQPSAKTAPLVEFDMMTWPEVKAALKAGKTTALFYTGGTEQRGPQDVNGGHTLMGRATVRAIALKLGNAIAMPVMPYTPNNASADLPGTIGLTNDIMAATLERLSEQAIATGFRNVVLMSDHGDGQEPGPANIYQAVATKLDRKYAAKGIHVYYCDQVYAANNEFEKYLIAHGYPDGDHGAVPDTSEMLYLEALYPNDGGWVRKNLLAQSLGDPPKPAPGAHLLGNGITGDGRRSSAALGKIFFDMKVDYAVKQIKGFTGSSPK